VVSRVIHKYKNNTHVRDTRAAALAVVIIPSLMAAAAPNTVCEKNGKTPKGLEKPDTPPGQDDCPKVLTPRMKTP
jgi:hypothetical protein